ncbi:MAG: tRNA (N(6)-L-threonylcarbamoyladenosine(37)-C(2))-methylthiotransferase MtaB [Alkalispirochaeta sp.]
MSTSATVAFETLGCKLNQYETDAIATELRERGFTVVDGTDGADAYVINSCTVTNKADRKSRNTLNRAVRSAGSTGVVVLTGCFVDSHKEDLVDTAATYVVDNTHKNTIPEVLDAHFRGEVVDPNDLDPNVFGFSPPQRIFHTRTNLKIQDGCDNFCTFCIIPFVRGRARSRPAEAVLHEAQQAIGNGARELVLTGVNMSRYHADGTDFVELVHGILALDGDFRLRISSLEPDQLDQRFVDLFRHPKMCPHLHLCLQSGSDRILLAMRRMYTVGQYLDVVERLREVDPDFTITTDVIVGFPGEGEAEFTESLSVADRADVAHVHMFPYSVRSGTRAERMPHHVSTEEKRARGTRVQEAAEERKRRIRERFVGRRQRVLVEQIHTSPDGPLATGLSEYYHPVSIMIAADADHEANADRKPDAEAGLTAIGADLAPNTFYDVEIIAVGSGDDPPLLARLLPV